MYYKEKFENGKWYWQTVPGNEWHEFTVGMYIRKEKSEQKNNVSQPNVKAPKHKTMKAELKAILATFGVFAGVTVYVLILNYMPHKWLYMFATAMFCIGGVIAAYSSYKAFLSKFR